VIDLDTKDCEGDRPTAHMRHRYIRGAVILGLIKSCGIEDVRTFDGVINPDGVVAMVKKLTPARRAVLKELGITIRSDAAEAPMTTLGGILKLMGLKSTGKQRKIEGERVREYRVAVDHRDRMARLSARCSAQLRAPKLEPDVRVSHQLTTDEMNDLLSALEAA